MTLNPTLARATGILYVGLFVFGMLGPLVLESILVPGDAAATAANLEAKSAQFQISIVAWFLIIALDLLVSATLYWLLREVRPLAALIAGASRFLYTVMLAPSLVHLANANGAALGTSEGQAVALASLEALTTGFTVALVFFGMHLVSLSVAGRGVMPRWVLAPLSVAGAIYIADNAAKVMGAQVPEVASGVFMVLAILGELALLIWLFRVGGRGESARA